MTKEAYSVFLAVLLMAVSASGLAQQAEQKVFEKRTDVPIIGHTDPSKFRDSEKPHDGAGILSYFTLLDGEIMDTNYLFYHRGVLMPKSGIGEHIHRTMEEMYMIFDGPAQYTVNGHTAELPTGSMVLCPMGSSHAIYNPSDRPLQWMNIGVGTEKGKYDAVNYNDNRANARVESPAPFLWAQFDRSLLHPAPRAHGGKGAIMFRRIWSNENFKTNWYFVDHCLLPPDTSIGYHQHNTIEEVYYVLSGTGRYTVNDKTVDVKYSDALPCRLHDSHGIYNNSNENLEIMVVSVASAKGYDRYGKNWGDDLSDR
ncbi:cupin domain-containing protein [Candidatus Latescibacterota bacterium]